MKLYLDSANIVVASLKALVDQNKLDGKVLTKALKTYGLSAEKPEPFST